MRILVSISFILFISFNLIGQNKIELEQERLRLLKKIDTTSKVLKETKKTKEATLSDLKLIDNQIADRQKLINTIQQEVQQTDKYLSQLNQSISYLDSSVVQMKNQYGQLIKAAYRNKLLDNKWLQMLNASSINDAFVRWRYIQQFENYTRAKLKDLDIKQGELLLQKQELNSIKLSKKVLLETEESQSLDLIAEKGLKSDLLKGISKTEKELNKELAYQKTQSAELNATIERIIQSKIAKAVDIKTTTPTETKPLVGASFESNKKRFQWPLRAARVDSKFGKQAHPKLKSVSISNNGIDISSINDQEVKAIFDGVVVGTTAIPGFDFMIVIQHGEFFSVYSKVENVYIAKGDILSTGQIIGIASRDDSNRSKLHFELWKNKQKLNPEQWLQ